MEKINTTVQDTSVAHQFNESAFETELIDRFFDANSYYLHGFMSYMQDECALFDDPLDTVALGLLVDNIINSSNKSESLLQLNQFDGFKFYKQQLYDGIKQLGSSKISTQEMMEIVGGLGKSLAETLIDLLSQQENRSKLLVLVGLDQNRLEIPEKEEKIDFIQKEIPETEETSVSAPKDESFIVEDEQISLHEDNKSTLEVEEKISFEQENETFSKINDLTQSEFQNKAESDPEDKTESKITEKSPLEVEDKTTTEVNEDSADFLPWSFFEEDARNQVDVINSFIEKFEKKQSNFRVFKQINDGFRDLRDWSMIQGDQGIEAISHKILLLFEKVYKRDLEKRSRILPILKESLQTVLVVCSTGRGNELLDIVQVMTNQIDQIRKFYPEQTGEETEHLVEDTENLEEIVDFEVGDDQHSEPQLEEAILPKTASTDEVEIEIAEAQNEKIEPKTELSVEEAKTDKIPPAGLESPISNDLIETPDLVNTEEQMDETNLNKPQPDFEQELTGLLTKNDKSKSESIQTKESGSSNDNLEDLTKDSFDSIRESEILSELVSENSDNLDEFEGSEVEEDCKASNLNEKNEQDLEEITLPGENDEELLEIISQLKEEQEELIKTEDPVNETAEDFEPSDVPVFENSEVETVQEKKTEPKEKKADKSKNGTDFVSEAEMYFSFGRKALQQLMKNSSNQQALEDMELACYSLKIIGNKLGYELIEKIMGYSEQLIYNSLSNKNGLPTDQINFLFKILDELEQSGRERSLNDTDRVEWLKQQEIVLKNCVETGSELDKDVLQPKVEKLTADVSSEKNKSEDPLDFLLFDDKSKPFKQVQKD